MQKLAEEHFTAQIMKKVHLNLIASHQRFLCNSRVRCEATNKHETLPKSKLSVINSSRTVIESLKMEKREEKV